MLLPLTIALVLVVSVVVFVAPGAALLSWSGLDRVVSPPLLPAAALAASLVPLIALTALTLALRQPIEVLIVALAAVLVVSWLGAAGQSQRHSFAQRCADPLANLVAGTWLRGTPPVALACAGASLVVALLCGMYAWNDSLYHIGQAQKLLHLSHPSFNNTLQFPDGSAHPGYFIPVWQEVVALVARISGQDPVTVGWILPALTAAIATLTMGGLVATLWRARAAASAGAAAWLVMAVSALPFTDSLTNGLHPGTVALHVLMPLIIALVVTGASPPPRGSHLDLTTRETTRMCGVLAALSTACLGVLHVSYLWVLGLGVAGYLLVFALRLPHARSSVRAHVAVALPVLVAAVLVLACLMPGLADLQQYGRNASQELLANTTSMYEGENGADLQSVVRGDVRHDHYHLRADYLVLAGGLAVAGLLCVLLTVAAPRWPGGWYLAGSTLLVLGIALPDVVFPRFVNVVSLDQARRIEHVLPLDAGLAIGALGAAAASAAAWRRAGSRAGARAAAALPVAAFAAAGVTLAAIVPPLAGYAGSRIVPPLVLSAFAVLLVLGTLITSAARRPRHSWTWPTDLLPAHTGTLAGVLVLVCAIPVWHKVPDLIDSTRLHNLPVSMRTAEMRLFSPRVARVVRDLPTGATVLADPRARDGYMSMTLAPVYVVSSVPRHTAFTTRNRVPARFEEARSFFCSAATDKRVDTGAPVRPLTRRARAQLLVRDHVDAVIMHPRGCRTAQDDFATLPGVQLVDTGQNQRIWRIDRSVLERALKSGRLTTEDA